jgi:hypothetical protein
MLGALVLVGWYALGEGLILVTALWDYRVLFRWPLWLLYGVLLSLPASMLLFAVGVALHLLDRYRPPREHWWQP